MMKSKPFAVLTMIAALMAPAAVRAQITTVILADEDQAKFTISDSDVPQVKAMLKFKIGPAPFPDATVTKWLLSVVPTKRVTGVDRAAQDVSVLLSNDEIGQWLADDRNTEPYTAPLKPGAFKPRPDNVVELGLENKSRLTAWDYNGGKAAKTADRPRLIVTYGSVMRSGRSGQTTDWKYAEPSGFFTSPLLSDQTLLANPVSYAGAVYAVATSPGGPSLYRAAGAKKVTSWKLAFSAPISEKSFAFATAWGRLQIITKGAIGSCDLTKLGSPDTAASCDVTAGEIKLDDGEAPAIGPDGSLYFKNVLAAGSIVAYNPARKEIWRTDLKFTTVSPIALNASGRYAYALAEIDEQSGRKIYLVRVDTAMGKTVGKEVKYKDKNIKEVFPDLKELLRPRSRPRGILSTRSSRAIRMTRASCSSCTSIQETSGPRFSGPARERCSRRPCWAPWTATRCSPSRTALSSGIPGIIIALRRLRGFKHEGASHPGFYEPGQIHRAGRRSRLPL